MTMTPAETLRSAAKLVRERAQAASPGPWHQMCMGSEGCQVINDGRLRERRHVSFSGRKEWKADHADAEYIAGVNPLVGAALADLFDRVAQTVEADADLAGRVGVDEELAVARACLGETGERIMRFWPPRRTAPPPEAPREEDLIAYARAHVTSPGAHALLGEVERGRARRQSAHARLPVALMGSTIATMDFGRVCYTVPWAMWADTDGMLWLHPDYMTEAAPQGTVSMRVERRRDGYHVWPVEGRTYRPQAEPGYHGTPSRPFIPVAVIEGAPDGGGQR